MIAMAQLDNNIVAALVATTHIVSTKTILSIHRSALVATVTIDIEFIDAQQKI